MNWAAVVWLVLLLFFILAEAATVTIVSLWFAVGALVAMIASMLGAQVWLQTVLFVGVSLILLLSLRPITRKYFTPRLVKTNVDSLPGSQGLVITKIDNVTSQGQVKLGAMEWTARSTTGQVIEVGTRIRVDRIEGVKVFVSEVQESVQEK